MSSKWLERLKLTAQGMTAEEVALKQSVSVQAVNASLLNARRKLNARNTTEAVYRACKSGLIILLVVVNLSVVGDDMRRTTKRPNMQRYRRELIV